MIPFADNQPRRGTPVVTILLIAINALVFLYELSLGPRLDGFLFQSAFIPARLHEAPVILHFGAGLWSGLLSMFLHGGWLHFLGNMLFLWIFGDNVEDRLGHGRFLIFYLLAGYVATFAHAFANPASQIPAIGASGAISGVLGAYLFLHPTARIRTLVFIFIFFTTIEIPALIFLPLWFLLQLGPGLASIGSADAATGGVAWFAHIGGFIAGPILLLVLGGRRRPSGGYDTYSR
ncbi:MAG TPA: rhomboid family intramembrane serine protease [Thermoanaerobaculia bacterium]|nr:rhomboid family intramembrane serine protease [Thermoanaerobaculia bacterium]